MTIRNRDRRLIDVLIGGELAVEGKRGCIPVQDAGIDAHPRGDLEQDALSHPPTAGLDELLEHAGKGVIVEVARFDIVAEECLRIRLVVGLLEVDKGGTFGEEIRGDGEQKMALRDLALGEIPREEAVDRLEHPDNLGNTEYNREWPRRVWDCRPHCARPQGLPL